MGRFLTTSTISFLILSIGLTAWSQSTYTLTPLNESPPSLPPPNKEGIIETGITKKVDGNGKTPIAGEVNQTGEKPLTGSVIQRRPRKPITATARQYNASSSKQLRLDASGFYYQPDERVFFSQLRRTWQQQHRSAIPQQITLFRLNRRAYNQAKAVGRDSLLVEHWHLGSAPAPWTLEPKVLLTNESEDETLLDIPLEVEITARLAPAFVRPGSLISDGTYFQSSGAWVNLFQDKVMVQVLPPKTTERVDLPNVELFKWLKPSQAKWVETLKMKVTYPGQAQPFEQELTLTLNHSALPYYLY